MPTVPEMALVLLAAEAVNAGEDFSCQRAVKQDLCGFVESSHCKRYEKCKLKTVFLKILSNSRRKQWMKIRSRSGEFHAVRSLFTSPQVVEQ